MLKRKTLQALQSFASCYHYKTDKSFFISISESSFILQLLTYTFIHHCDSHCSISNQTKKQTTYCWCFVFPIIINQNFVYSRTIIIRVTSYKLFQKKILSAYFRDKNFCFSTTFYWLKREMSKTDLTFPQIYWLLDLENI